MKALDIMRRGDWIPPIAVAAPEDHVQINVGGLVRIESIKLLNKDRILFFAHL